MSSGPRRVTLALGLASLLLITGCVGYLTGETEPWAAPAFTLVDTDGVTHNLTDYRGRVLIVDLMATWCGPCEKEMPHLKTIRDAYPEDEVAILSVGADPSESDAQLAGFRDRFNATWPIARDTDGVGEKLKMRIIPKLVIIDPDGEVVFENQRETYPAAMARVVNSYVEA